MKSLLSLICCVMVLSFTISDAFAFYCKNKIIDKGLSKGEVKSWCGDPTFVDRRKEERNKESKDEKENIIISVTIDEWMYNFGPNSFIEILIFENGLLREINTGDYGWASSSERETRCDSSSLLMGAAKSELFLKCGEPHEKNAWEKTYRLDKEITSTNRRIVQTYEEWSYKTGPGKILIFKFSNGKLLGVRTVD
ncbi:MAG: DUF2845 domain-containing protein [Proteobacteria bacterium]|nr:DUF2845 domain-containing protein [Pseudomonadota bacterium]